MATQISKKMFLSSMVLLLMPANSVFAQPDTLWTRTYGGPGNDFGESVQQTYDGGFIVTGGTDSFSAGGADIWLIRTDARGEVMWTRTFGSINDDYGHSVQQTSDGGFIVTGYTGSFGAGELDLWLIRTDASGNTLWTRTFGGNGTDIGYSVQQTSDGGFIIAGITSSFGAGEFDVWLIRTDASGDTLWTRTFGGNTSDLGYSVQQTYDGGFIVTGSTRMYSDLLGTDNDDLWLIRTDSLGNVHWDMHFGDFSRDTDEVGRSVQQTSDGGFIVIGSTESFGNYGFNIWLIRTNPWGDPLWSRTFGGSTDDRGYAVQQTAEGGFIVAGISSSTEPLGDLWLIRTDASGHPLWTRTFGGDRPDGGLSVHQTSDGGFIVAGYAGSFGLGSADLWLIRLDSDQIMLSVREEYAFIGDTVRVPVDVDFPADLSFSSAKISFDNPFGLQFIEVDTSNSLTGSAGWHYQVKEYWASVTVAFAGAEEISGEGVLFWLKFVVSPYSLGLGFISIALQSASFDENLVPTGLKPGGGVFIIESVSYGDVSLDGTVQPYDASLILKYLVGDLYLNGLQRANGDVNISRTLSAWDASLILQYTIGLIDELPYTGNLINASGNITMVDGALALGQTVEVPLLLSNGENILSFEGVITYNPQHLTFSEIVWSDDFSNFIKKMKAEPGKIKITGANSETHQTHDGVFATLRFTVNEDFDAGETVVTLSRLRWNEEPIMEEVASATLSTVTGVADQPSGIPEEFALNQNYPNPFNPTTTISYQLPRDAFVTIGIYNIVGQLVATLVNERKQAGYHSVTWNASRMSSGLFIYELKAGNYSAVRKGLLLK